MKCAKSKCKKALPIPHYACRCGARYCTESCFLTGWQVEHKKVCPNALEIEKEQVEKVGGAKELMKKGNRVLVQCALTKVFEAAPPDEDSGSPCKEVCSPTEAPSSPERAGARGQEETGGLDAEPSQLRRDCEELQKMLEAAEAREADARKEIDSLQDREKTLRQDCEQLEKQLGGEAGQAEISALKAKVEDLSQECALERDLKSTLEDEVAETKKLLQDAAEGSRKSAERASGLDQRLALEREEFRKAQASAEGAEMRQRAERAECEQLRQFLTDAGAETRRREGECRQLAEDLKASREAAGQASSTETLKREEECRVLQADATAAREEADRERLNCLQLRQKLEGMEEEATSVASSVKATIDKGKAECDGLRREVAEGRQRANADRERLADASAAHEEYERKLQQLRGQLRQAEAVGAAANAAAARDTAEAGQQKDRECEQLRSDLDRLREAAKKAEATAKAAVERIGEEEVTAKAASEAARETLREELRQERSSAAAASEAAAEELRQERRTAKAAAEAEAGARVIAERIREAEIGALREELRREQDGARQQLEKVSEAQGAAQAEVGKQLKEECQQLLEDVHRATAAELEAKAGALESNKKLSGRVADLEQDLEIRRLRCVQLDREIKQAEETKKTAQAKVEEAVKREEERQSQIDKLRKEVARVKKDKGVTKVEDDLREAWERALKDMQNKCSQLKADLEKAKEGEKSAKATTEEMKQKCNAMQVELMTLRAGDIEDSNGGRQSLRGRQRMQQLQSERAQLLASMAPEAGRSKGLEAIEQELAFERKRTAELEAKLASAKTAEADFRQLAEERQQLLQKLQGERPKQETGATDQELAKERKRTSDLEEQLASARAAEAEIRKIAEERQLHLEQVLRSASNPSSPLSARGASPEEAEQKLELSQRVCEQIREDLERVRQDADKLRDERDRIQTEAHKYRRMVIEEQGRNEAMQEELKDIGHERHEARREVAAKKREIDRLQRMLVDSAAMTGRPPPSPSGATSPMRATSPMPRSISPMPRSTSPMPS